MFLFAGRFLVAAVGRQLAAVGGKLASVAVFIAAVGGKRILRQESNHSA